MTLNIGLIGTGWFGQMHAKLLNRMDGVQVTGVVGSSLEKGERMARELGTATGYGSVHDMLGEQRVDAVYICVPPFAHGDIEATLLEHNIPFFLEKPLGTDLEIPTAILEKIESQGLITSVGYHFRYLDSTTRALGLLEGQKVGMALGYWMGGMPEVYWWRKQDGSGGQFVEQTTHIVDLVRFLLGEVDEVYAAYGNRVLQERVDGVTVPDVGSVTLKMASGAVVTVANTCILPNGAGDMNGLHIYTGDGVLEISQDKLREVAEGWVAEYQNQVNPYEVESQAFIKAVHTGDTSGILSTYSDAWKTQQVTVAAGESARTGKVVRLREE